MNYIYWILNKVIIDYNLTPKEKYKNILINKPEQVAKIRKCIDNNNNE